VKISISKHKFLVKWWQLTRKWPIYITKDEDSMIVIIDDDQVAYELSAKGSEHTVVKYKKMSLVVTRLEDGTYTLDV